MQYSSPKVPTIETYLNREEIVREYAPLIKANAVWYPKGAKAYLLLMAPQTMSSIAGVSARSGIDYGVGFAEYVDQYMTFTYDPRGFKRVSGFLIAAVKNDPAWIENYVDKFWAATKVFVALADNTYWDFFSRDAQEIKARFSLLVNRCIEAQSYGYLTESFTITTGEYWVTKYIQELAPTLTAEEVATLLQPTEASFLGDFIERARAAATELEREAVVKEFYWVKGSYSQLPEVTTHTVQKEAEEGHEETTDFTALRQQKVAILGKALHPEELARFVDLVEKSVAMQDGRKANVLRLNYALYKIASQVHDAFPEWPVDELLSFAPEEILALLDGRLRADQRDLIAQRNKQSLWILTKDGYCLSTDPAVFADLAPLLEGEITTDVRGYCASRGIVRGTVRIVLDEKDFSKIQEGDVLVTMMTRPEFMPVMQKASAFVTNEGGITCHAAIISREMKKPCIIGTKNATKVLRDGDLVEVDADKGVVTILEKA